MILHSMIILHSMESANITPVFKKNDQTAKTNYRPISILPNLSLKFSKGAFINNCGLRKGFNARHSLLKLLEILGQSLDRGLVFGVLLTEF